LFMTFVNTVRGSIDAADLGPTLMHEHVFILSPEFEINFGKIAGFDADHHIRQAAGRLRELKEHGIDTIVDLTVLGMGRNISYIQRVNAEVDINIVVATGVYALHSMPMYLFVRQRQADEDFLLKLFLKDITEGIGDSGVKATLIKCCTDVSGVTTDVEQILRASARANVLTGVPISTHTDSGTRRGLEQQDIFAAEGVDLRTVVIGHCGDTTDTGYLTELVSRGSFIGMDRFGMDRMLAFRDRVGVVVRMCELGHADRMVLSHDAACFADWYAPNFHSSLPNWHYCHISRDVLPALREQGVTEDQIHTMLVDNPARILSRAR